MKFTTPQTVGVCLIYFVLVGSFALWQHHAVVAAGETAALSPQPSLHYDAAMRRLGIESVCALALIGGVGLGLYMLLVRRGREVTELLEQPSPAGDRPRPRSRTSSAAPSPRSNEWGRSCTSSASAARKPGSA